MPLVTKPNVNKVWAETGVKVQPPDEKTDTGWVVERPPYQYQNFLQHKNELFLKHINQAGIPEWDAATVYTAGKSYVQGSNGTIYLAILNGSNQNPVTTPSFWRKAILTPEELETLRVQILGYRDEAEDFAEDAEYWATQADLSAASAATSATNASNSASNASASATDANASRVAASTSENNALGYRNAAQASANAAATSETNAAASANTASNQAIAAAGSATTATTQATNAGNSATAASGSATAASNSATTATNQATAASNSASAASTSATNANTARIAAEAARDEAQAVIAPGTTAQYWRGDKTWQTLNKTAVGLSNVDNTSDVNKPVSAAQSTAINAKVSKAGDTMTGPLVINTPGTGVNAQITLNRTSTTGAAVYAQNGGLMRWSLDLGGGADTGTASGGNLRILRYNNAGSLIGTPIEIARDTGTVGFSGEVHASLFVSKAQGQGLRADNYATSGTVKFNNVVQASADYSFILAAAHNPGTWAAWQLQLGGATFQFLNDGWGEAHSGWRQMSDRRIKFDIEPITDALKKVRALKGYTYLKRGSESLSGEHLREPGLIAQEVQSVLPSAVALSSNGYLSLNYNGVLALAIEAVNELVMQVERAEARINALESTIAGLVN